LVQVYVEVAEDIDDGRVKGEPKPRKQEIPEDDDLIVARLRYGLPARGSRGPNHAVPLKGAHIGSVDLASAEGVHLRDFLCDNVAPSLWGHGCDLNAKYKKNRGAKETLRQNLQSFELLGCGSQQWGGVAQESVPFYSALAPINPARDTQIYLITLMIASHNCKISKGQNASFTLASVSAGRLWDQHRPKASVSVGRPWEFRSPFFAL
jgi:hypothetical protein